MAEIEKINILIVDDIDSIRNSLAEQLKDMGVKKIFQGDCVPKAKQILGEQKIQFIISDWNMPGESGLDFLKYVRAEINFRNIPFVLLTTVGEEDQVLDAIMSGASNYVLKPWKTDDLKDKLSNAWKKHNPGKPLF